MSGSTPHPHDDPAKIADVLQRTRATLRRAKLALEDVERAPNNERRVAAMHNVVVMGRAVTNVLQNLRHAVQGFDEWYKPWQTEMRQDPLLRYLYELRSEILKQGKDRTSHSVYISSLRIPQDLPPRPPNAVGIVIGDQNGGTGWRVQLEDGTTETLYVELPEEQVRIWLGFEALPGEHLGAPITDNSLATVCRLYVQYLQRLVTAAEHKFGRPA